MADLSLTYHREHLPTGTVYISEFTPAQHTVFADVRAYPPRYVERVITELIATWNRQQPGTWRYTYISGENNDGRTTVPPSA